VDQAGIHITDVDKESQNANYSKMKNNNIKLRGEEYKRDGANGV
jgi:hypothetical protein